ncbi:hypothetical protein [Saccharopolyspora cebuensis]|uniref:Uncharacterized protein n=1 Tax=Saccharopolyspora cebuensis TaxID=418759 RepID=A0ABV4CDJ9_9PSEU
MRERRGDVVLRVNAMDGQYHIRSSPGVGDMWPASRDGLFVGEDNWVAVLCGTFWGPVDLSVREHDAPLGEVDRDWDMAAEWSLDCPEGTFAIHDIYSNDPPHVVEVAAGWTRLRLSVRGRTRAREVPEPVTVPVEQHLLELWPAPAWHGPAVVHGPDGLAHHLRSQ